MRLFFFLLLISLISIASTSFAKAADDTAGSKALRRVCEYLWSQQADDGGWHSKQYAMMRSGQALTPFVLHTLLSVPESVCPRPEGGVERALEFIRKHVDDQGAIGRSDPDIAEYPVYSTAYAVQAFVKYLSQPAGREARLKVPACDTEDELLVRRMADFLRKAQFNADNGFDDTNLAFGGWGFDAALSPGQPGHMDLAHTRRALQALADAARLEPAESPFSSALCMHCGPAQAFLAVVQRHPSAVNRQPHIEGFGSASGTPPYDGGFYFSPVVFAANKGREEFKDAKYFRSYATATCDGLLALLAAGVPREDERVAKAIAWLKSHDDLKYPQGVPTDQPENWGDAIRFYHYAARAEAFDALDWPGDWRNRLAAVIAPQQAEDGSFRNTVSPLMKEDDSLLCTALAAVALTHSVDAGVEAADTRQ